MIHDCFLQSSYSVGGGGTESDLAGTVELSGRGKEIVSAVSALLNSPSKRSLKSPSSNAFGGDRRRRARNGEMQG